MKIEVIMYGNINYIKTFKSTTNKIKLILYLQQKTSMEKYIIHLYIFLVFPSADERLRNFHVILSMVQFQINIKNIFRF